MNTEDKQSELPQKTVDQSRRALAKIGLATPIIMTLASKPVFAVQGLSNMLSTHGSATCRGDYRYGGMSPGFWVTPHGTTDGTNLFSGDDWKTAWSLTGFAYADPDPSGPNGFQVKYDISYECPSTIKKCTPQQMVAVSTPRLGNKASDYVGGTLYSAVFGSGYAGLSLREVMDNNPGSDAFHLIAGLLNARYFEAKAAGKGTQYIFTETQFWDLYNNRLAIPKSYTSLVNLIESNYHNQPGSCKH